MKFLVVSPFGLGDAIFAFGLIEAIRRVHPDAVIDFVANERTRDLVAMNPSVGRVYEFNRDALRALWAEDKRALFSRLAAWRKEIAAAKYDVAFDLSLGREYSFFLALAGVRRRIGFDFKGRGFFLTQKIKLASFEARPVREAYFDLLELWAPGTRHEGDYPVLRPGAVREWRAWASARGFEPGGAFAILAPGGGRSWGRDAIYKQWAPEKFAAVARELAGSRGWRILIAGDGGERELCDKVRQLAGVPGVEIMTGEPLGIVKEAFAEAQLFVGNDGGLLHLADLARTPAVGLYGPVDELVYGPRVLPRTAIVKKDVACRPCYKNFRFPPCVFAKRCLEEITLDDVMSAIQRILKEPSSSRRNQEGHE